MLREAFGRSSAKAGCIRCRPKSLEPPTVVRARCSNNQARICALTHGCHPTDCIFLYLPFQIAFRIDRRIRAPGFVVGQRVPARLLAGDLSGAMSTGRFLVHGLSFKTFSTDFRDRRYRIRVPSVLYVEALSTFSCHAGTASPGMDTPPGTCVHILCLLAHDR